MATTSINQSTSNSNHLNFHHQHFNQKSLTTASSSTSISTIPLPRHSSKSTKGKAKADFHELESSNKPSPHPTPPPFLPPPLEHVNDEERLRKINELDQNELGRHWGPHLVPLQVVIQNTIAQVFKELQIVAETSPSLDDFERKKRVIDYVIHSRRQIIKLLVLVKWSANAAPTHKIMSIVGFLQRQNQQFERTVNILKASKDSFYSARLRNYDIPTALQVLTQGHPTLPGSLVEQLETKPRLEDEEVIGVLEKMDEAIRYRLAGTKEVIPKEFRSYTIADGRVTFRVENMFECSATLGGAGPNAIWYLLHLKFLFPVRNPHGNEFPAAPQGAAKQHIIEMANSCMAPCAPTESDPEPKPPERPLMKLFAFLRELSLNYQLESLHFQAHQLERSAWADHTRIFIAPDRSSLTIHYWLYARPQPKVAMRVGQQPPKRPPPIPLGSMTIRRKTEKTCRTKTRIADFLNGYPLLDKQANTNENEDGDNGASYTKRLQLVWVPVEVAELAIPPPPPTLVGSQHARIPIPVAHEAPKLTLELLESFMIRPINGLFFKPDGKGSQELELELDSLDLEHLINKVIRAQMDAILQRAFSQLAQPPISPWDQSINPPSPYFPSVEIVPWEENSTQAKAIRVVLHPGHVVQVNLDRFSGRFKVLPVILGERRWDKDLVVIGTKGSVGSEFEAMDTKINTNPSAIKNLLVYLKSEVLMREVEANALRMGIRAYRDLSVDIRELVIHSKPTPGTISNHVYPMFTCLGLVDFPNYYLTILIKEVGLQCSLVVLRNKDGKRSLTLEDKVEVIVPTFRGEDEKEVGTDKFTLTPAQLGYVYHQCLIQAALHCLGYRLHHFQLPFKRILPIPIDMARQYGSFKLHPAIQPLGLIVVPVKACFKSNLVDFLFPNIAIKIGIGSKTFTIKVEAQIRFKETYKSSRILTNFLESKIDQEQNHKQDVDKSLNNYDQKNELRFYKDESLLIYSNSNVNECWDGFLKALITL
ncbi:hypothetical protein CROQUDRAFT_659573 [Cronartium quercuum f. sp. fusiforme G11]|uniref:Mediator of RNA polymerase II transcription subunit 14 n=1 Tax=Cronartium quercuum f. sp. fusiforme G11 TaxID=708437 RepID=A0A9P6TBL9_9BASI|nr:hypothetical protein CROQUDRAFT_659573 [Cronartium quercuum f. sp. fusiforme G11]